MKAQRWITIGQVRQGYVIIVNCGFPNGWRMTWQGRVDWNQPNQFIKWEQVMWAVVRRLELAGLALVNIAQNIAEPRDLRVLVNRHPEGKRRRVKL